MKSKLNYLITLSLKRKVSSKWFKIVNILLFIAIIAIANIDSIIKAFGGDFDKKQKIYVVDNTNISYDLFKNQMLTVTNSKTEEEMKYEIILFEDEEEKVEDFLKEKENQKDLVLVFNPDEENTMSVKVISYSFLDIYDNSYIQNAVYNTKVSEAIITSDIDQEKLNNIYSTVDTERIVLDEEKNSEDENMEAIMTTVFPVIILPFFILVIYLTQMVGAEINDEKTTKGMEVIISSVSPTQHFFSKIVAGNLFVIGQGLLLFIYGFIGFKLRGVFGGNDIAGGVFDSIGTMLSNVLNSNFMSKLIYIIPLVLILMILSFISYSLVAGILASMTTNNEDFQQIQTPIMLTLLVGYYLAILAGMFDGSLLIRIFSYVPFISAILSPSLLVMGEIGVMDILVAILINVGVIALLIKYGLRIYKVGILNYSSTNLWKKMAKALKTK